MVSTMVGQVGKFMSATHMGIWSKPARGAVGAPHVANAVDGQGILAVALHDGGEVVLRHLRSSLAFSRRSRA